MPGNALGVVVCLLVAGLIAFSPLVGLVSSSASKAPRLECREGYVLLTRAAEGRVCVPGYRP